MKLRVKYLDISSGGSLLVILNKLDAAKMDLHSLDRVKVSKNDTVETVTVHIGENSHVVQEGTIGIYHEVEKSLGVREGDMVSISLARKPLSLEYIRKKLDGQKLGKREIDQIVWDITHNKLSDIELTYFVAACYTNTMSMEETVLLTKAIASNGAILKFKSKIVLDKHCIGGIPGNRTTMILVPLMAAAGYTIPKTSSRSITSPAGTADTMETLACVSFSIPDMQKIVAKTNGCIVWGGALNLAPADDKIIHVEKPLEIDAESQLLASIMAKKYSVSSTHILIDIPLGNDAKVKTPSEAAHLKRHFEQIGKKLGKKIKVVLTDGSQPIGNGIGPSLEARDVLWVLKRDPKRPLDLEKKCISMAAEMFSMIGVKNGKQKALDLLNSGAAYTKMEEIIATQFGKKLTPEELPIGKFMFEKQAEKTGTVRDIDNIIISRIARIAGAPVNKGSGLFLHKHIGDKVKRGDILFTIYSESREKLEYAVDIVKGHRSYLVS